MKSDIETEYQSVGLTAGPVLLFGSKELTFTKLTNT